MSHIKNLSSARSGYIFQFLAFWAFISFILAFWAFISFHFSLLALDFIHYGLLSLHFLSFWPFGPYFLSFWLVWAATWGPPTSCQKWLVSLMSHIKNLTAPGPATFFNFWPFGPSFSFILVLSAFISLHFGLLGFHSFILVFLTFNTYGSDVDKTANGQTKVQTYGPPNLEKITCLRQQRRKTAKGQTEAQAHGPPNLEKIPQNRQRADQGPNLWATKPGENLHAYGSSVEKTATGQTKVQTHGPPNLEKIARLRQQWRRDRQRADQSPISISQLTCFKMKTVRCSARPCTPGRSHVLEGLTPKLNPKPVKVKMRVERQRGWDTQKQSERAMKGGACQPTNSPPLSRDYVWTP